MKTQIILPENIIQYLIHSPESGMDYQKVNLILKNGKRIPNVIINFFSRYLSKFVYLNYKTP